MALYGKKRTPQRTRRRGKGTGRPRPPERIMDRVTRTVRGCEEQLEELQDYLGRLADLLDSKSAGEAHEERLALADTPSGETPPLPCPEEGDPRLDALKQRVENLEERLREAGNRHVELSDELREIMDDAQVFLKAAGIALMLVGLGGALALCCASFGKGNDEQEGEGEKTGERTSGETCGQHAENDAH